MDNSTLPIDDGVFLTWTLDILKAIARGDGPPSAMLALGYAGWGAGQLENEIQQNGWLHCAADPELIFGSRHRPEIRKGAAEDRHRSRHAVERSRPRVVLSKAAANSDRTTTTAPSPAGRLVSNSVARSAVIGSPKAKPCAYSQPSW